MIKRMKSHILYVFMMFFMISVLSCAPNPGPESIEAGSPPKNDSAEPRVFAHGLDSRLRENDPLSTGREMKPKENKEEKKLTRLIDYVRYSKVVFDHAFSLGALLTEFDLNYDWKNEKPYLRGGPDDGLGKLLKIVPSKYSPNDSYLGLIEILQNRGLLQELINFFTSEPFLTPDQKQQLISAIQSDDLETIGTLIDTLYLSLFKEFSDKYHVQSEWKETSTKDGKKSYEFVSGGFKEGDERYKLFIGSGSEMSQASETRKSIVKLFKLLLKNYFELRSPISSSQEESKEEKQAY